MAEEKKKPTRKSYTLVVPVDASGIQDRDAGALLKVAARGNDGKVVSEKLKLGKEGKGEASLTLRELPKSLRVAIGPVDASDEELLALQTITLDVTGRQWAGKPQLKLPPVSISPYYWYWWLRWCRTFTIRGVLRCPDGRPVPGAKVCAYDVDWFWWWSNRQLVGCDTTDANGAFEIEFRWCCGWWPWWWWRRRFWQLEPELVKRLQPELLREPNLPRLGDPSPQPSLELFQSLLSDDGTPPNPGVTALDPERLPALADRLIKRLPRLPELEQLRVWPWRPWLPWWDCHPDIVFEATQTCEGQEHVVLEESVWDTRWNIPTHLDVSLVSSDEACCLGDFDEPEGDCLVIDSLCNDLIANIGGNPPAAPGVVLPTDGFRNPAGGGTWSDRPYAGNVPLSGRFGLGADVDYYEFEVSDDDGLTWNPLPTAAAGGFTRLYWGPQLGTADPPDWHAVPFGFNMVEDTGGTDHYVIQSRQRFEADNDPASWGISRFWWSSTMHRLMTWRTAGLFSDGRYRLRLRSWTLSGDKLGASELLPLCGTQDDNGVVVALDNRTTTGGPTNANGQACGAGTVHVCTTEPDTDIISIKILHPDNSFTEVAPCGNVPVTPNDKVLIDFAAYDPDGHLARISLDAHWGEDQVHSLLPFGTLAPLGPSPVPWSPPAVQAEATYAAAQGAGAVPPIWHGGTMRLTVGVATDAFPISCCYLLRLVARKRTIVNCDDDTWTHVNISERSFMIQV